MVGDHFSWRQTCLATFFRRYALPVHFWNQLPQAEKVPWHGYVLQRNGHPNCALRNYNLTLINKLNAFIIFMEEYGIMSCWREQGSRRYVVLIIIFYKFVYV